MKEIIKQSLKQIELDYQVKILYACESGSRAWGFPSADSDYDVRFIYVHQPEWYLSIDQQRDVIELPINDRLDISGWELTKALRLFRKCNPSLIEWLSSGIIYQQSDSLLERLQQLKAEVYAPKVLIYHYLSMATGNYREYLRGDQVKIKKYFYVLRPLLACKWIEKYHSIPPLVFQELVEGVIEDPTLKQRIAELLQRKIAGVEFDLEPQIPVINQFIEAELSHLNQYVAGISATPKNPTDKLNELFRTLLQDVWAH